MRTDLATGGAVLVGGWLLEQLLRDNDNVRDWIYVEDHVRALRTVWQEGRVGEAYDIEGDRERTNLEVAEAICDIIDEFVTHGNQPRRGFIKFVHDRSGHDYRYATDMTKIQPELRWRPRGSFDSGLFKTVKWYVDNERWWRAIRSAAGRGERLGTASAALSG